jgi:hypothetical protein
MSGEVRFLFQHAEESYPLRSRGVGSGEEQNTAFAALLNGPG